MKKEFKTLDEQINILKYKGLIIDDYEYTKEVLLRENYFFINGYRHLFLISEQDRRFIPGTTFNEIYSLFIFDREFRNSLFKKLLVIENNIKSVMSYQLSKEYGYREKDYLKSTNFTKDPLKKKQVNDLVKKMQRQIRTNSMKHTATSHYISNYGYVPLWILVKVLSFGIVGELYQILKVNDQNEIAEFYNMSRYTFIDYLPILSNYRNLCAHEEIVYENKTQRIIDDTIYHEMLEIPQENSEYIYGKNDCFALIIIMKQFLTESEFKDLLNEIRHEVETLDYNLKSISLDKILDRMGFPSNWYDLANIEKKG